MARRRRLEDWLDALRTVDPATGEGRRTLAEALGSGEAHVIARVATLVRAHEVEGLFAGLAATYTRLFEHGVTRDPGCVARLAIAEALDAAGHLDATPFRLGVRYVQREPVWGGTADTAMGLRSRCAAALIRLHEPDALDVLADHLVDPEVKVRADAAALLADLGGAGAAALLRLKVRVGDREEEVTEAALAALLDLAPAAGLLLGGELLAGGSARLRQLAGLALGASRQAGALPLLVGWLELAATHPERHAAFVSLGLLRHADARARLLQVVEAGTGPDAHAAIEALAIQRGDPEVEERVRAAAARSRHDLRAGLAEWFPPNTPG